MANGDKAAELPEELIITLRKPVKLGDITYTELKLREPTAGEMRKAALEADPIGSNILLISTVAGLPKSVVEKIGARDLNAAVIYLTGFTRDDRPTGS